MANDNLISDADTGMQVTDTKRYDRMLVLLHWLLALALIGQLVLGLWMVDLPKEPPGYRGSMYTNPLVW
jgi:cytochrome b561